jgi:hypothetical protein
MRILLTHFIFNDYKRSLSIYIYNSYVIYNWLLGFKINFKLKEEYLLDVKYKVIRRLKIDIMRVLFIYFFIFQNLNNKSERLLIYNRKRLLIVFQEKILEIQERKVFSSLYFILKLKIKNTEFFSNSFITSVTIEKNI